MSSKAMLTLDLPRGAHPEAGSHRQGSFALAYCATTEERWRKSGEVTPASSSSLPPEGPGGETPVCVRSLCHRWVRSCSETHKTPLHNKHSFSYQSSQTPAIPLSQSLRCPCVRVILPRETLLRHNFRHHMWAFKRSSTPSIDRLLQTSTRVSEVLISGHVCGRGVAREERETVRLTDSTLEKIILLKSEAVDWLTTGL